MVAYSFAPQFVDAVASLTKRQTVRAFRKRHARPGEPVQLYTAMRTRQCRKLVAIDPICIDVREIRIVFDFSGEIELIYIDGLALEAAEMESFAEQDGFGASVPDGFALSRMGDFWREHYGEDDFAGVVIRWEPRSA